MHPHRARPCMAQRLPMGIDDKARQAGRLLFVLDLLFITFIFLVAFHLREALRGGEPIDLLAHVGLLPLVLMPMAGLMWHAGAYRQMRVGSVMAYTWVVLRCVALSLVILFTVLFLLKAQYASRSFLLLFGAILVPVLVLTRVGLVWWYFHKSPEKGENYLKVVIIGTGERASRLSLKLRHQTEWGLQVVGYLDTEEVSAARRVDASLILGTVGDLASVLQHHIVDEVIIALPRTLIKDVQIIADVCEEEGVKLRLMADIFDLQVARMRLEHLDGIPLLSFEPVAQDESHLIIKRIFDLVVILAAMPVMLPVMACVAVAVYLDSPGPIFFRQPRVGLHKRIFSMYKFRSMHADAEQRLKEIEHLNEASGPIFKMTNDPRVTRVGGFLRRTSLDELPQLFNVLRGHMSLVGPRPMSLRDVGLFDKGIQRKRFSVRPGLTCLWQVSGRSSLPFSKWLELDLFYIENWSLWLDLKILLKTIPTVLKGSGAV